MRQLWKWLHSLARMLKPTGIQLVAAFAPALVYSPLSFGQGEEVLSMLGESAARTGLGFSRVSFFFWTANAVAGLAIWWTARTLLLFPVHGQPSGVGLPNGFRDFVQTAWPRFLGWLPSFIVALALWARSRKYPELGVHEREMLQNLAWRHVLLGLLLLAFFWGRRWWLEKSNRGLKLVQVTSVKNLCQQSGVTVLVHVALLVLSVAVLAAIWRWPLSWSRLLGTGAMLSLAAASWVTFGTWLMLLRTASGAPVFLLLGGIVLLFSLWNDNHFVRLLDGQPHAAEKRPTVSAAYAAWLASLPAVAPPPADGAAPHARPLFIVATEGGGIRAAFWTATVLGKLQQESQLAAASSGGTPSDFASHLFAISGVSGGSVGAAVFDALNADNQEVLGASQAILGYDHLAPLLGGLLFPESAQLFWFRALPGTDRGAIFEHSMEAAYQEVAQTDRCKNHFSVYGPRRKVAGCGTSPICCSTARWWKRDNA